MAHPASHSIRFGDNKAWAIGRLKQQLAAGGHRVMVTGTKPSTVTCPVVWVEVDGGRRFGVFEGAFIRLNTFAPTREAAHDTARLVDGLLTPDGAPVVAVERQSGPNLIFDEGATYFRYYSLHAITVRGEDI